jgi:uncharacterized protein (TIGR03435 family)
MSSLHLVSDHLWQSTLFAAAIALVAVALRRKHAGIRYALWWTASIKFIVPFALFGAIGEAIGSRATVHVPPPAPSFLTDIASTPFVVETTNRVATTAASSATVSAATIGWPALIVALWAVGCAVVLAVWIVRWTRAYRAVRAATPYDTGREVAILRRLESVFRRAEPSGSAAAVGPDHRRQGSGGPPKPCAKAEGPPLRIRLSDATIEPGVFGIWRPVLLWPRAMSAHLSDDQIETILVHELSHVRRRDNLTALAHGLVQAICWFHPLVWWIGARLIDERERACDEAVVRAGRDRQVYAESLLKTCQFCVGAPVMCMAGVTGSDLKRRVTSIMAAPVGGRLGVTARVAFALAIAAIVAVPAINGAAGVPQVSSTITLPDPSKAFDAASVRQNKDGDQGGGFSSGSGKLTVRNLSLRRLILFAFRLDEPQLIGGPGWLDTDRFDVVAKADAKTTDGDLRVMAQNLLVERFSMKVHTETRNLPIYALVMARPDGQLGPNLHVTDCGAFTSGQPPCGTGFPSVAGPGVVSFSSNIDVGGGRGFAGRGEGASRTATSPSLKMKGTMASFAGTLSAMLKRPVVNRTSLDRIELELTYTPPGAPASADDGSTPRAPELFTALQEQLGLKLEATRGPVEVLVIDSAEHPKNDDFEMPAQ